MGLTINTNLNSLTAQRNLKNSQSSLSTAMARLSSGLRINSAKDDAAGLAIATRMTTQINGLDTAINNANNGVSLAQTTEGALTEVTNNLQRIRELAVESANATNSVSDRAALDAEVQQRLQEINRLAAQTTFNGRKVLDGSFGTAVFQVGANVGETIRVDLNTSVKIGDLGQIYTSNGSADLSRKFANGDKVTLTDLTLQVGDAPATKVTGTFSSAKDLAAAITDQTGGAVYAHVDKNNHLVLEASAAVTVGGSDKSTLGVADVKEASGSLNSAGANVKSVDTANQMLMRMDAALQQVGALRSALGAIQSRFDSVVASAQTTSENVSSARSTIQDADFASETANMTRAEILQQAGTAILAQANSQQENVLSLLKS